MSITNKIALFAKLRPSSERIDIDDAVAGVVDALIASIGTTSDIREARRNVASLLNYLHALKTSRHPGRGILATALGERVLPLLYEPEKEEPAVTDTYPYLEEETAVVERAADMMAGILRFLCAKERENPRHGLPVRDDGVPPFFLFTPEFREGFRRLLTIIVRAYMRNKQSETAVYKQVRDILAGKTKGDISRYDRQITNLVRTALDRAQEHYIKSRAAGDGKAGAADDTASDDVPPEQEAARDALEVAYLHARDAGYFLPYSLDFEGLASIFTLNRKSIVQGLVTLGHAKVQGESENYVIRQIDRLNETHDLIHYDITVLSAFIFGNKVQRISYKQMHDACLGAARNRSAMLQMRPFLVAELARRPQHLIRRLIDTSEDTSIGREAYEEMVDLLTRWLSDLNGRRFEDEISACISQLWGNEILKPIVTWIEADRRDPEMAPMVINDISILREEIFRRR